MFSKKRRVKRGWMNMQVVRIVEETHDCKTFFLQDADDGSYQFDYFAGQYLTFRFDSLSKPPAVRSYTLSSCPREKNEIAITVKKIEQGFVSDYFCDDLQVGSILRARGPIGKFVFAPDFNEHLVMVAGGSGITPFYSISKEYEHRLGEPGCPKKLTLIVSYKTNKDIIFARELSRLNKNTNIEVVIFLTREKSPSEGTFSGRLDLPRFNQIMDNNFVDKTFMVCGPDSLTKMLEDFLIENKVDRKNLVTESFAN
jgi:ferredoxin-NADP reductase